MTTVTELRVKELINEQLYSSASSTISSNFTLQEKVAYALKLSLNRITTDAFAAGKEWFSEPEVYNPVLKSSILKNTPLPYSSILNFYIVVKIDDKKYITNIRLSTIVTTYFRYNINTIVTNTNNVLSPISLNTESSYSESRIPILADFNNNGLLTKLPRNAWASFVYWKKQITGTKAKRTVNDNPTLLTGTGTYPDVNNLSSILTFNGDETINPSTDITFTNINSNPFIRDILKEYESLELISNTIVDNYIASNGALIQINTGAPTELLELIYFPVVVNLSVPTISTWNSNTNYAGDNMAFYNPLIERSLSETFGYKSSGQGNGYGIVSPTSTTSTTFEIVDTQYGFGGNVTEGTMIFNGDTGFVQFFGLLYPITNTSRISVIRPPIVTALKYVGETLTDGVISQLQGLPNPSIYNEKELRIDTETNTIYRLGRDETDQKAWISIGGGGGGGKWSDVEEEEGSIYYKDGNVYIGKDNGTFTLDLSGSFNLNDKIKSTTTGIDISGKTIIKNELLIGKDTSDYKFDLSGSFNLNDKIKSTTTGIDISTSVIIKGNLTVDGNYTIRGDSYIIHTDEVEISNNTIILNSNIEDKSYGGLPDIELESGIIIKRAKIDDEINAEPFKIVYKDERSDPDEYLSIGISGDLHRVATIDSSKNNHNNEFVLWNATIGTLKPSPMLSISNESFIIDNSLQVIGNLLDICNNKYISGGVVSNNEELPETARENQIFINTTDRKIYRYTGTEWLSIGGNDIFKEVGDERTYTERSVAIGKSEFTPDISYSLDVSGLINLNNQIITSATDISLISNVEVSGNLYTTKGKIGIGTNIISTNSESLYVNQTVEGANTGITINSADRFSGFLTFRENNLSRWLIGNSPNTFNGKEEIDISNNRNTLVFSSRPTTTDQLITDSSLVLTSASIRDRAQVVFTQDGRVGIGSFDPSAKLDVSGSVKTRGDIYTPSFDESFSSVFPHQDESKDIGLWGILNKMFDQPPKFKENGTTSKSTNFVVKWEKAFSSLKFSHDGVEVPYIEKIGIDISGGTWNVFDQNIDKHIREYTFTAGQTYGGVNITIEGTYDIRVYGINQSNSTTYNYLLFENMAVIPPKEPSEPRNVSFVTTDVSFTYIKVKYDAPVTFNLNIEGDEPDSDKPALENYKIVYKPEGVNGASFNTLRNSGISDLCQNEITFLATTNLNYDASNIITQIIHNNQLNPIYPASRYVLKEIRAKNILNNAYSENGVIEDIVITTPPPPVNYGGTIFSSFNDNGNISELVAAIRIPLSVGTLRTFNIGNTKITGGSYVNISTSTPTTSFTSSTNTSDIYINRHIDKLGTNYRGRQRDTYVQLYYNTSQTDISYQTLYYNGFNESGELFSLNTGSIDICNNETQQDIDICFNQTSVITSTIPAGFGIYRGYGIYGTFGISFLPNSIGIGKRFAPKTGVQKIGYKVKSFTVDTKKELLFYVDNLEGFPSVDIKNIPILFNPTSVRYCYGVPSLGYFDVSCTYTVSNYAKYYLPPDGRYSKIDLINSNFITTPAVDKNTTDISTSIITTHTFINIYIINNFTDANPKFERTLRITPYNLNELNPTGSINLDITYNKGIHVDVSSFVNNIPTSTIKSFGSLDIYKYNNSSPYALETLDNISSSSFVLSNNQMIFYRGAFRSGNTGGFPFANYGLDYGGESRNYSSLLNTGDIVGETTYKWVTKKVATNIPTHEETTRERTLTVNGSSNLPTLNNGNILVFVLQKYTNTNNTITTYGSTRNYTVWYNALKDFNGNATTNVVNYDTPPLSDDLGIRKINGNGKIILYYEGDVNKTWDIYVRIGLPINSTFAITSIGFS